MSSINTNGNLIRYAGEQYTLCRSELNRLTEELKQSAGSIREMGKDFNPISRKLNEITGGLTVICRKMSRMEEALEAVLETYECAENHIAERIRIGNGFGFMPGPRTEFRILGSGGVPDARNVVQGVFGHAEGNDEDLDARMPVNGVSGAAGTMETASFVGRTGARPPQEETSGHGDSYVHATGPQTGTERSGLAGSRTDANDAVKYKVGIRESRWKNFNDPINVEMDSEQ